MGKTRTIFAWLCALALIAGNFVAPPVRASVPQTGPAPAGAWTHRCAGVQNSLWDKGFALRQQALQMKVANPALGDVVRVAGRQYVDTVRNAPAADPDRVFTILVEFKDTLGPTDPDGPSHNQITAPIRDPNSAAYDNSTYYKSDFNVSHYTNLLFTGANSMANYFREQSRTVEQPSGIYNLTGTVQGWVRLSKDESYYGSNSGGRAGASASHGAVGKWLREDGQDNPSTHEIVKDALAAWAAGKTSTQIQQALTTYDRYDRYDHDADSNFNEPDGYIDHLMIVHAGEGEESGGGPQKANTIWSHHGYANPASGVGPSGAKYGGWQAPGASLWAGDYVVVPENAGVGTLAHEFAHDLGLQDEHDQTTLDAEPSSAFWSLMSSGMWLGYGSAAAPADIGVGVRPGHLSAWAKLNLGWLKYARASHGTLSTHNLGPAEKQLASYSQGLVTTLPARARPITLKKPVKGASEWYSGMGDRLNNTLTRAIDGASTTLSMKAWYEIEQGCDYLYVEVHDGVKWHIVAGITGRSGSITGNENGWLNLSVDLRRPLSGQTMAGPPRQLRLRYATDGAIGGKGFVADEIKVTSGVSTLFDDEAVETGNNGWTPVGFKRVAGQSSKSYNNYYVAEYRQYVDYDDALKTAYQRVGFTNKVEHFRYQDGLLISYWDTYYSDNNVSDHPGEGMILPIDSHPGPLLNSDNRTPSRTSIQIYDATFGRERTEAITVGGKTYGSLPYVAVFNDLTPYFYPSKPDAGVKLPGAGQIIETPANPTTDASGNKYMQVVARSVAISTTIADPTFVVGAQVSTTGAVKMAQTYAASSTVAGRTITSYELQQSTNGGPWTRISLHAPTTAATQRTEVTLAMGDNTYQFQVRAKDSTNNWGSWVMGPKFKISAHQESELIYTTNACAEPEDIDPETKSCKPGTIKPVYPPRWSQEDRTDAYGGSLMYTCDGNSRVWLPRKYKGHSVAWVSSRAAADSGPGDAQAEVWVDGKERYIKYTSTTVTPRTVAYAVDGLDPASPHAVFIYPYNRSWTAVSEVVCPDGHENPRTDVDAFLVMKKLSEVKPEESTYSSYEEYSKEPFFQNLWGLHNTGQPVANSTGVQGVDTDANEASAVVPTTGEVVVAVLDTGIDFTHPDLVGLRDTRSWNFVTNTTLPVDSSAGDRHGTHIAGAIAGRLNGMGIVGIAPRGVKIMALKVCEKGRCDPLRVEKAIRYAASKGVKIVNMSFTLEGPDSGVEDAISDSPGVLFVAAAGQDGKDIRVTPEYPASYGCDPNPIAPCRFSYENVLAVAAINNRGALATFRVGGDKGTVTSNYGKYSVDISAPGQDILSSVPYGGDTTAPYGYDRLSGTSMAAAYVSGAAALVMLANPGSSADDIKTRLINTGKVASGTTGKTISGKLIDVAAALDYHPVITQEPTPGFVEASQVRQPNPTGAPDTYEVGVRLDYSAFAPAGIDAYDLEQRVGDGAWSDVPPSALTATGAVVWLQPGASVHQFRLKVLDSTVEMGKTYDNWSDWKESRPFTVTEYQENSSESVLWYETNRACTSGDTNDTTGWILDADLTGAYRGKVTHTDKGNTRACFRFPGSATSPVASVAWVSTIGVDRGKADLWDNNQEITTVDLFRWAPNTPFFPRYVVFTRNYSAAEAAVGHEITIYVQGDRNSLSLGNRVDVDAMLVLRYTQ